MRTSRVSGRLIDQAAGMVLLDEGEEIPAPTRFTADKATGSIDATFKLTDVGVKGITMGVFESLIHKSICCCISVADLIAAGSCLKRKNCKSFK